MTDLPRPGAKPALDTNQTQQIVAMVCAAPPDGFARWTVRLIAEQAVKRKLVPTIGRATIRLLLLNHDLKPWREKSWCIAELDQAYVTKMEDVLAVYKRRLDPAEPVVCLVLDEKPVTLHAEVGRRVRRVPVTWPSVTLSTNGAAPPTCFAP